MPPPTDLSAVNDALSVTKSGQRKTDSSFASLTLDRTPRNSSLQKIWAEDYYTAESEDIEGSLSFGGGDLTTWTIPSAQLTSRSVQHDIPLPSDEEATIPRQTRTHQRSLTALLPSLRPMISRASSQSPERKSQNHSPIKEEIAGGFMPTLTGDSEGKIKVADKSRGLASWFSGTSAPVQIGLPVKEQEGVITDTMSSRSPSPERPAAKLAKRRPVPSLGQESMMPTNPAKTTNAGSRFNFFSSPKTPVQHTIQVPSELNTDEFLTIDIHAALFPGGPPTPQDAFSPSSFKNLLMNAEGLLCKLQDAYKARTLALHALEQESRGNHDELEEATTRAECLRAQLDALAARVTAQDQDLQDLSVRLQAEQKARANERIAREKSIALVRSKAVDPQHRDCDCNCDCVVDDELGIAAATSPRSKHKRDSGGSAANSSTDLSGESDAESLFSRSRSSTMTAGGGGLAGSILTTESTPEVRQATFGRVLRVPSHSQQSEPKQETAREGKKTESRPRMVQQPSTFQKILKGIAGDASGKEGGEDTVADGYWEIGGSETECRNCRGKESSLAWDAVGLLRAENRGLKERLGVLESAVEGALDLVAGVGRI